MDLTDKIALAKDIQKKPTICPKCKVKYDYTGLGHYRCPECGEEVRDDYAKVRDYLEIVGKASIEMTSKKTGVSVKSIKELINDGRLSVTNFK